MGYAPCVPSVELDATLWSFLNELLARTGVTWQRLLLSWARVLPLVLLVPAFGSRLMPAPARAVFGVGLAIVLLPAVPEVAVSSSAWVLQFVREVVRGLPIALASAAMMWAAMMAGGLIDDLRGAGQHQSSILPDAKTPLAAFLGLFSIVAFLQLGGVSSAARALANDTGPVLLRAVADVVYAIDIAFALVAPLLCVSVVWEVASAMVARAASPAYVQSLLSSLRSLVLLGGFGLVMPRVFELLVAIMGARVGS